MDIQNLSSAQVGSVGAADSVAAPDQVSPSVPQPGSAEVPQNNDDDAALTPDAIASKKAEVSLDASAMKAVIMSKPQYGFASTGTATATSKLTDAERALIPEIHRAKHLDGTPLSLGEFTKLRDQTQRMLEDAKKQFGPQSTTANYLQDVVNAYNEEIGKAKPLANAIDGLKNVLANPSATSEDYANSVRKTFEVLHDQATKGTDTENDPRVSQAMNLTAQVMQRDYEHKVSDLQNALDREKKSPGSVSDDEINKTRADVLGAERQAQMMGLHEGKDSDAAMKLVTQSISVVADRHVTSLNSLLAQEKASPGSVPEQQLLKQALGIVGDVRQEALLGMKEGTPDDLAPVTNAFQVLFDKSKAAVDALMEKQKTAGSGVTNQQINEAISKYDAMKNAARLFGANIPEGNVFPGVPQLNKQ